MAKFAESVNSEIARICFFGRSLGNGLGKLGGRVKLYALWDDFLGVASSFPNASPASG
jgi:hypothetical protein